MAVATGVQLRTTLALADLAYTDDFILLGDSYEVVRETVNGVHHFAIAVGLRINITKTKVLYAQVDPSNRGTTTLGGVSS